MNYSFEPVTLPTADEVEGTPIQKDSPPPDPSDAAQPELPELHVARPEPTTPADGANREQERIDQARSEAHQRGFEEGRRSEGERLRALVEAVNATVEELRAADARREREAFERVAALAAAIAGHLIEREVKASPEVMSDLVRRAVAEFPISESLAVHLNPSDLALLSSGMSGESGRGNLTSGQSVRWVADPSIRSGGCLVEGTDRVVDARLGHILERVVRALTDA